MFNVNFWNRKNMNTNGDKEYIFDIYVLIIKNFNFKS